MRFFTIKSPFYTVETRWTYFILNRHTKPIFRWSVNPIKKIIIHLSIIVWGVIYESACLSVYPLVRLSGPTSTSFVRFPPNFVEYKIMMSELCSIKDCIVHWVLPLLCLFGLRNFETIQYAHCHPKFSYIVLQKFMKLCTL